MSDATSGLVRLSIGVALIVSSWAVATQARSSAFSVRVLPIDGIAHDLNNHGQVVGLTVTSPQRAFLWDEKRGMQLLESLGDLDVEYPLAINNRGQVAGGTVFPNGFAHAFLRVRSGAVQDLGSLVSPAHRSIATALNERGQVVGFASVGDDVHGFFWTANINNRGHIVGRNENRAVLWTDVGSWHELGVLGVSPFGDYGSWAFAINDRGWVVGTSTAPAGGAFLWTPQTGMINLGHLDSPFGDYHFSQAVDINNRGTVVGMSYNVTLLDEEPPDPGGFEPFVWTRRTGMVALNRLVPNGLRVESVIAINDKDVILASGFHPTLGWRALLLEPTKRTR
jgi:probable HAF family extracellular repeat protein